jgi:1,4-dihydroxy-2-naphthoyl-CoA hydrolase
VAEDLPESMGITLSELDAKMGVVFVELTAQRIVATMPVEGNRQPYGLLHGGASVALGETLGSVAAALNATEGRSPVGIEINATHHRSATSGTVTGTATPIHVGRTLVTSEIVITDDQDRRVCTIRLTCLLRETR